MALTFVYGNSGSGKSAWICEKIIGMAQKQPRRNFYVLVPEQFTMQAQRALVERAGKKVLFNIDVLSFERLAYRVFDELGVKSTIMEETGKSLLLRRIAEEKSGQLTALKGNIRRMGYIGELKSMISELMQYGISARDLGEFLGELTPGGSLFYKLSDIHVMYGAFEESLSERYVTAEKVLELLMEVADESALLQDCVIALDGFTGFTPVQMKLLHRLMHLAGEIYVSVTLDVREDPYADLGMQELFFMSRKMVRTLTRAAVQEGFGLAQPVLTDPAVHCRTEGNPVLFHLEQNLFRPAAVRMRGACGDALRLYSLASPRAELQFVAAQICRLMRTEGYRYAQFAIVTGDVECYGNYAESVFRACKIPYFVDRKRTVLDHPLIELIRAVLEMIEKDFSYESVFRYLRTGLAGFDMAEVDLLENYVIARGVRGAKKWSERFQKPARIRGRVRVKEEQVQEELARADALRKRLWEQTAPLVESFAKKDADVREQTVALYEFLCRLGIEEQLRLARVEFEQRGEEVYASEYRQIYKIVIDLLDKMVDLLGEEILSVRDYADVLEAGFAEARVGSIPPGSDCVILGDIERTRLEGIRALFFVGVNDGLIPKNASGGGILSQYDREILENKNLELSPTVREQAFLQRFYLYLALTKPSDMLCLTCARMNADGKAIRPSYLMGTLKKLFEDLSLQEIDAQDPLLPTTPQGSVETYISGLLLAKEGKILPEWKALHQWFLSEKEWAPVIGRLFDAAFARHEGETLESDVARLLYGSVLTNSVTRLELFARCAYAHFLEYGLKLSEREEYAFASLDMGSMFHAVLQKYCQKLESAYDWYQISREDQDRLLAEAMRDAVLTMPNDSLLESARSTYVLERIYRILRRSVWALTEQIRSGKFRPAGYEVEFVQVSSLELPDLLRSVPKEEQAKQEMRLVGRIDRMDTYEDEGHVYVRVIDYKSGNTTFQLLNLYYGQQLQLVVYLNAAMERLRHKYPGKEIVPAGIFYYRLDDPMVEEEEGGEEAVMKKVLEKLRLNGLVSLEPEAYRKMDLGLEGKSLVVPLTLKKDGSVSARGTSGAGREDFAHLGEFVSRKIREAAGRILEGEIEAAPYARDGGKGCDYCTYRSVCGFDLRIPGYHYCREEHLQDQEIWDRIRKKEG